jgi:hypothetical protein
VRFTLIAEFDGRHSVCQIESSALSCVAFDWTQTVSLNKLGLSDKDRHFFFEDLGFDGDPVALVGMENAWCHDCLVKDGLIILTIFLSQNSITEVSANIDCSILFSFCTLADGGIYVSQYIEKTHASAQKLWLNEDEHWSQSLDKDTKIILRNGIKANRFTFEPISALVGVSKLQFEHGDHKLSAFCILTKQA